jgi:hypothetical protein
MTCMSANVFCQAVVSLKDFVPAEGAWKGTLTYLDYSSGKQFTMPANVDLRVVYRAQQVILVFEYPKEPKANGNDTLFINRDGSQVNGATVTAREIMEDGAVRIVTEKKDVDGNDHRNAVLRHMYIFGKDSFQNRKEVKFEGSDKWIMRNEYLFSR